MSREDYKHRRFFLLQVSFIILYLCLLVVFGHVIYQHLKKYFFKIMY